MSHQQPIDEETARAEAEAIAADVALWHRHQAACTSGDAILAAAAARERQAANMRASCSAAAVGVLISGAAAIAGAPWPCAEGLVLVTVAASLAGRAQSRANRAEEALMSAPYDTLDEVMALLVSRAWTRSPSLLSLMTRLLSGLEPDQVDRLTPQHVAALHQCIRHGMYSAWISTGADTDLKAAALRALRHAGDVTTLDILAELLRVERRPGIIQEARACRAAIRSRTQTPSNTLLRPASAPADTLLRPAPNRSCADEETLLRPAEDRE